MTNEMLFEKMKEFKKSYEAQEDAFKGEWLNKYMEENLADYIEYFEKLLDRVNRNGMDKVKSFIQKSDFYRAPASTKYHSSFKGGLLLHTLFVYCCFMSKKETSLIWKDVLGEMSDESAIIICLLHDICKTYFYTNDWKNRKKYHDGGTKKDEKGRFDWEAVPFYICEDKYPLGHGEKSVMFIQQFIHLSMSEMMCIRWHMGFSESKDNYMALQSALKLYPEAYALHEADSEATYLMEIIPE